MAEIILPPEEEQEETPQAPELNIDKPTENSKVITIEFEAKKTNKVSTKDTNQQLYTTDTDAWFEFKETSLEGANGTYSVVFKNGRDGSIFQRTGDVVDGVAYYKIPHQEIRHAGAWRGQVVYTLSNGDTTSREFGYDVQGHILDGKDVREIVVEDFETLMSQLRSMKENAEVELANLTQDLRSINNTAEQNETDRQAFFNDLVEDIDELQANYQELLDTGVLQTNINTKLEQLEQEYAPKLTEVTAQLAQIKNDNVVDLVLFMGQSNMAGRGVASEATVLDDGEGYEFKAITDPTKLYKAIEPFGRLENNPNGITETTKTGGMVTSIMKNYYRQTGIPIVGVSASKGGTSINDWLPNTVYYNDAVQRYTLARSWLQENGYTIRNQFVVWCQGETDGDNSMSKDEYITKFGALSDELLTAQQIDKIFMVRIGNHREVATRYDTIIEAQTEIGKIFEDVVMVSLKFAEMAELGLMKDSYHYTQAAYNIVGLESGVNMGYYVKNLIKPYMEDPEYNNVYIPFVQNNYIPYNRTIFPFNNEGENGLEINDFGVLSGGKITTTTLDKGAKRLDAPFKVTSDYDWTIEAHIKNTTTDSRAVIMSAGANTGGFLNLPNAVPSPFRLRDLNNTFTVTAVLPTGFDGTIPHSYAVTSRNGKIRMFVDFEEVPTTISGSLVDFHLDRLLGGYSTASYDFVGECYYIALTEGKALEPEDMHRE